MLFAAEFWNFDSWRIKNAAENDAKITKQNAKFSPSWLFGGSNSIFGRKSVQKVRKKMPTRNFNEKETKSWNLNTGRTIKRNWMFGKWRNHRNLRKSFDLGWVNKICKLQVRIWG